MGTRKRRISVIFLANGSDDERAKPGRPSSDLKISPRLSMIQESGFLWKIASDEERACGGGVFHLNGPDIHDERERV